MIIKYDLINAIRMVCNLVQINKVAIIGSQSIYAYIDESRTPEIMEKSRDIDIYVFEEDSKNKKDELMWLNEKLGEDSLFDDDNEYYIDIIHPENVTLPSGWRQRVQTIKVKNKAFDPKNNNSPKYYKGLCLNKYDTCIAKLIAYRDKDRSYVLSLIENEIINPYKLLDRLIEIKDPDIAVKLARGIQLVETAIKRIEETNQKY